MKPPYFLNESPQIDRRGDLNLFETEEALLGYVEPVDVENGEYFAFDAEGRLLSLASDGKKVFVAGADGTPEHAQVLAQLLRESLAELRLPDGRPAAMVAWIGDAALGELVARAMDVERAWQSRQAVGVASRLADAARRWLAHG